MSLDSRLRHLEDKTSSGQVCPDCRHRSGEPMAFDLSDKYADWHGHPEVIPTRTCQECGAVLSFSLSFEWNAIPETVAALVDSGAIGLHQDAQNGHSSA
jgi:hypothetical protein